MSDEGDAAPGSGPAPPAVSVSLVTYNGRRWLRGCFASLRAQSLPPLEILVVDNASTDGTAEWLRNEAARDPRLVLAEFPRNVGFSKAHNHNIFAARGEFICLLNQDVELDEAFLEAATKPFARDQRIGAVQARLRRLGPGGERLGVIDSTGLSMSRDRRVVSRGQGERDGPRHWRPGEVWGPDGPAPLYRRSALLDARLPAARGGWEVLDEDFFMYKEDVDLAWRLRNIGWTSWYEPSALAWHARGAGSSDSSSLLGTYRAGRRIPRWIKIVSWRNHRLMQVKNENPWAYVRDLPWIARREFLSLGHMLLTDPARLVAIGALARGLPAASRKRRYLAARRRRVARTEGGATWRVAAGASWPR